MPNYLKVKSNINRVVKALQEKEVNITEALKTGLHFGMRLFEGHIIKNQMSKPRGSAEYFGLSRQTGTLVRSWFLKDFDLGEDYKVVLGTNTRYAKYWEKSLREGAGSDWASKHPPKLDVTGEFQREGAEFLTQAIVKQVGRFITLR